MDMIRWLATNKVVITVWGLGILAILLASIFGGSKEVENKTATAETKAVEVVAEKAKAAPAVMAAAATGAATAVVVSTVQAAVETKTDAAAEVTETVEESAAQVTEVAADGEAKVADAVVGDAETSTDQAVVEEDNIADKSSDDLLMMAREAYWDNGLDKAASLYSELITREPTVIEHKGELGNVYWRQGYPKKAAELYSDIAQPMIEKGNGERVSNMVGFIGLFFPERASSIRKLLDAQ